MTKFKSLISFAIILIVLAGCNDRMEENKYARPDWLAGKIYTQIVAQPELSTFAKCLEITGYDSIINVSGSYTVFGPSNTAWDAYLSGKPEYNSVEDIPIEELKSIVKYHMIQNAWSKIQLRTLDIYGWIDTLDLNNDKPRGFKRETLEKEPNRKYGVEFFSGIPGEKSKIIIVDTTSTNWHRRVITDSRKYAPIFYQEYFDIYNLKSNDYTFYFNRTFDGGNDIYFAGAKIISDEIFAENGFIYIIDEVVEPLDNAMEMLTNNKDHLYDDFLHLANEFPKFEYNEQETLEQPGAEEGLEVDSLFDLTFPTLAFDLNAEKTSPPTGTYGLPENVTVRYHHGLMAPTNSAFNKLLDDYIRVPGGWGSLKGTPEKIKRIIVNTYLSTNTIYPTDFENGFYNGENDIVILNQSDIIEKRFGSNCSFIGLNEPIVPRAFKSITGPVYLRNGFSKVMYGIEESGLLPTLKRPNKDYMFFVESDANTAADSSFMYDQRNNIFYLFKGVGVPGAQKFVFSLDDLRTMFLNQVGTRRPLGIARKEFIPNLAGNYIIVNNETGEYSGTAPTTFGYHGYVHEPEYPTLISTQSDNGITFKVNNWFSYTGATLYSTIATYFPRFHQLLIKAGLADEPNYLYSFISDNEYYTVFIPSDEALDDANVDDLPKEELKQLLLFHFVKGQLIFTDGYVPDGYFETNRIDESSTTYTKRYTKFHINPGIDEIDIPDKNGDIYTSVIENDSTTNILTAVQLESDPKDRPLFTVMFNNAVIHVIDKVLDVNELDIR